MSEKAPIVPNKRLQQTQAQVNEVVDIMRVNVDKVLERDKNLSELDGRAGECEFKENVLYHIIVFMSDLVQGIAPLDSPVYLYEVGTPAAKSLEPMKGD
ncbi:unnamed protein product [Echinostoma caproni]|uniref:V-SNARE coiled-coil homology domain-containing protein n=1 Tax=Echinostoma caproni TaxID=27848 RepID=A0A183B449_9TREM|nr:unnamed protein product [Echinostoma caproni]